MKVSSKEAFAILNIYHGRVSVSTDNVKCDYQLEISLAALNPLITGYKDIGELSEDPHVKVEGGKRAVRLIEVLFPTGSPMGDLSR